MVAPIIVRQENAAAAEISGALQQWNEKQAGPRNTQRFALTIRSEDGELLGGLVGEMFWTFLYVADLWVTEHHRGRGFGRALMACAEELAARRGCTVVFLSTMMFQAPEFYEKCGYRAFGTLPHAPADLGRIWFAKQIEPSLP